MSKQIIQLEDGRAYRTVHSDSYIEDLKDEVYDMTLKMIRKVKSAYGDEASAKLISSFREVLGTEWSQKAVRAILEKGVDGDCYIMFTIDTRSFNKPINLIKAIRMGSGLGLYDAKKSYDMLRDIVAHHIKSNPMDSPSNYPCIRMYVSEIRQNETLRELHSSGAIVF